MWWMQRPAADCSTRSDCEGLATTLAPGVSLDCTVTYVTTQADLDVGGVTQDGHRDRHRSW